MLLEAAAVGARGAVALAGEAVVAAEVDGPRVLDPGRGEIADGEGQEVVNGPGLLVLAAFACPGALPGRVAPRPELAPGLRIHGHLVERAVGRGVEEGLDAESAPSEEAVLLLALRVGPLLAVAADADIDVLRIAGDEGLASVGGGLDAVVELRKMVRGPLPGVEVDGRGRALRKARDGEGRHALEGLFGELDAVGVRGTVGRGEGAPGVDVRLRDALADDLDLDVVDPDGPLTALREDDRGGRKNSAPRGVGDGELVARPVRRERELLRRGPLRIHGVAPVRKGDLDARPVGLHPGAEDGGRAGLGAVPPDVQEVWRGYPLVQTDAERLSAGMAVLPVERPERDVVVVGDGLPVLEAEIAAAREIRGEAVLVVLEVAVDDEVRRLVGAAHRAELEVVQRHGRARGLDGEGLAGRRRDGRRKSRFDAGDIPVVGKKTVRGGFVRDGSGDGEADGRIGSGGRGRRHAAGKRLLLLLAGGDVGERPIPLAVQAEADKLDREAGERLLPARRRREERRLGEEFVRRFPRHLQARVRRKVQGAVRRRETCPSLRAPVLREGAGRGEVIREKDLPALLRGCDGGRKRQRGQRG